MMKFYNGNLCVTCLINGTGSCVKCMIINPFPHLINIYMNDILFVTPMKLVFKSTSVEKFLLDKFLEEKHYHCVEKLHIYNIFFMMLRHLGLHDFIRNGCTCVGDDRLFTCTYTLVIYTSAISNQIINCDIT